jgi:hypothetical protein
VRDGQHAEYGAILSDYPITRLPDYPITRLPDYPITRLPDSLQAL